MAQDMQHAFLQYASLRNAFLRLAGYGVVSLGLCALPGGAPAGAFTRGCAARDLQILMLIEDREGSKAVSADTLSDAMLSMLEARIVCHEGRVTDAIALYDGIAARLADEAAATHPK
jgi:hypothetical protein